MRLKGDFPLVISCVLSIAAIDARADVTVGGRVHNASTGEPVAGAIVRVQAAQPSVFTDEAGRFSMSMPVADDPVRVVAGAKGYFYQGLDVSGAGGELAFALERVPHEPDEPVPFIAPAECSACHREQYDDWRQSAMAHAGRNAWVEDFYSGTGTPGGMGDFVYVRDSIFARRNPASECGACHQPEAWADTPHAPMRHVTDPHPSVTRGVSCLTCHLMADVDESKPGHPGLYPGVVTMSRGAIVRYGTLGDVDYHAPGRMRAAYQPQLSAVVCSTCHQDSADPTGQGHFDGVVSEPTYLEWLASPYADPNSEHFSTCMDCHSDPLFAQRASVVAEGPARTYGELRSHRFEGTTPRFLDNAVRVELTARKEAERLLVDVALINHATGHHVPTGVTIRNVILLVEAQGRDGELEHLGTQRVDALGGVGDPAQGYYAGLPGKLYAKVNQTSQGQGPTFFTEAASLRSDNRVPALATDRTSYAFRLPASGEVKVRARVIYRRAWRATVDAKGWTADGHGRPLADLSPPHFGHLMASAEAVVRVDDGCGCAAGTPRFWLPFIIALRLRRRRRARAAWPAGKAS